MTPGRDWTGVAIVTGGVGAVMLLLAIAWFLLDTGGPSSMLGAAKLFAPIGLLLLGVGAGILLRSPR